MKIKRSICVLFGIILMVTCSSATLTSCSKMVDGPSETSGKVTFHFYGHGAESTTKTPKYQEEVLKQINEKLQNDLGFTADFKVTIYPDDTFGEKLMLDLAAKKPVDFARINTPAAQVADLYNKHMILDITQYINKSENLKSNISENVWKEVSVGGKILAIPMPVFQTTITGWIRGDLLKKIGMNVPSTLSEFESFLKKVKEQNPSMVPYMAPLANMEQLLLGSFTDKPGAYIDGDGNIKPKFYDEGYKNFIAKLAEWYKQGLIDDSVFNTDENKTIDVFGKNMVGVAGVNIWQLQWGTLGAVNTSNPDWNITFLSPFSDAKKYPTDGLATEALIVPATSKNAEKAIQFANWCMYDQENYMLVVNGIQGKSYDIVKEGDSEFIKVPDAESNSAIVDLYQAVFTGYNGTINNKYQPIGTPTESIRAYKECSSINLDKTYVPITNYYKVDVPNEVSIARGDAEMALGEQIQYMIQGKVALSEWDKMIKNYESMGGLREYQLYTEEMKKAVDHSDF